MRFVVRRLFPEKAGASSPSFDATLLSHENRLEHKVMDEKREREGVGDRMGDAGEGGRERNGSRSGEQEQSATSKQQNDLNPSSQ